MSFPPLIADKPPHPSDLAIGDDSPIESKVLHTLCEKILIEAESQIAMTRLLISDINEALNAPLFGFLLSETAPIDLSPILRGAWEMEAHGGERRRKAATVEEMESEEMSSTAEEMMQILLPAYFKLPTTNANRL
ncbi:hypothetical protein OROHE_016075 [Orobanche hederae]